MPSKSKPEPKSQSKILPKPDVSELRSEWLKNPNRANNLELEEKSIADSKSKSKPVTPMSRFKTRFKKHEALIAEKYPEKIQEFLLVGEANLNQKKIENFLLTAIKMKQEDIQRILPGVDDPYYDSSSHLKEKLETLFEQKLYDLNRGAMYLEDYVEHFGVANEKMDTVDESITPRQKVRQLRAQISFNCGENLTAQSERLLLQKENAKTVREKAWQGVKYYEDAWRFKKEGEGVEFKKQESFQMIRTISDNYFTDSFSKCVDRNVKAKATYYEPEFENFEKELTEGSETLLLWKISRAEYYLLNSKENKYRHARKLFEDVLSIRQEKQDNSHQCFYEAVLYAESYSMELKDNLKKFAITRPEVMTAAELTYKSACDAMLRAQNLSDDNGLLAVAKQKNLQDRINTMLDQIAKYYHDCSLSKGLLSYGVRHYEEQSVLVKTMQQKFVEMLKNKGRTGFNDGVQNSNNLANQVAEPFAVVLEKIKHDIDGITDKIKQLQPIEETPAQRAAQKALLKEREKETEQKNQELAEEEAKLAKERLKIKIKEQKIIDAAEKEKRRVLFEKHLKKIRAEEAMIVANEKKPAPVLSAAEQVFAAAYQEYRKGLFKAAKANYQLLYEYADSVSAENYKDKSMALSGMADSIVSEGNCQPLESKESEEKSKDVKILRAEQDRKNLEECKRILEACREASPMYASALENAKNWQQMEIQKNAPAAQLDEICKIVQAIEQVIVNLKNRFEKTKQRVKKREAESEAERDKVKKEIIKNFGLAAWKGRLDDQQEPSSEAQNLAAYKKLCEEFISCPQVVSQAKTQPLQTTVRKNQAPREQNKTSVTNKPSPEKNSDNISGLWQRFNLKRAEEVLVSVPENVMQNENNKQPVQESVVAEMAVAEIIEETVKIEPSVPEEVKQLPAVSAPLQPIEEETPRKEEAMQVFHVTLPKAFWESFDSDGYNKKDPHNPFDRRRNPTDKADFGYAEDDKESNNRNRLFQPPKTTPTVQTSKTKPSEKLANSEPKDLAGHRRHSHRPLGSRSGQG